MLCHPPLEGNDQGPALRAEPRVYLTRQYPHDLAETKPNARVTLTFNDALLQRQVVKLDREPQCISPRGLRVSAKAIRLRRCLAASKG